MAEQVVQVSLVLLGLPVHKASLDQLDLLVSQEPLVPLDAMDKQVVQDQLGVLVPKVLQDPLVPLE